MEMIGIDVGGTGIKAAVVETTSGELVTAARARPDAAPRRRRRPWSRRRPGWSPSCRATLHAGIGFPAVILDGVVKTAANIDPSWIDTPADSALRRRAGAIADRSATTPTPRGSPRCASAPAAGRRAPC